MLFGPIGSTPIGSSTAGVVAATAGANATAPGAALVGIATITGGTATGAAAGIAPGASLIGTASIGGGGASGTSAPRSATAQGATLASSASIAGGAASSFTPPLVLPVNPSFLYVGGRGGRDYGINFPNLCAGDDVVLTCEYRHVMPPGVTIVSVTPSISVHAGADSNAQAMFVSAPAINGTQVGIRIQASVAGASYYPRLHATLSDGETVTLPDPGYGSLSVVA